MASKNMRNEIINRIIYPIIFCFIAISLILSFTLFALGNRRVEDIKSQAFDFNKMFLRDLANVIGFTLRDYYEAIVEDILTFDSSLQTGYANKTLLGLGINPTDQPSYYVNALILALEGADSIPNGIPGFSYENQTSLLRPMWFVDRDITEYVDVVNASKDFYEDFIITVPTLYSLYSSKRYTEIYSVMADNAPSTNKIYAMYPLNEDFNDFANIIWTSPWWSKLNLSINTQNNTLILDPYYMESTGYMYTLCTVNFLGSSTKSNCVNFNISMLIDTLQDVFGVNNRTYFIVDRRNLTVIWHSNLSKFVTEEGTPNITQAEFGTEVIETNRNALDFDDKIVDLTRSVNSTNYFMEFTKQGQLIGLVLVEVLIDLGSGYPESYLIGVTQPRNVTYGAFSSLGSSVFLHTELQIGGLGAIIFVLLLFYCFIADRIDKAATASLEDITRFGRRIDSYWHTDINDYMSANDETAISTGSSPNKSINKKFSVDSYLSTEFSLILKSFSQVMKIVKAAKEAQDATSDAEALMNYSKALKIFEALNHTKGLSVAYSNIGRLHFQNQRLEEAIQNYQKAIEMVRQEIEKLKEVTNEWTVDRIHAKKSRFLRSRGSKLESDDAEVSEHMAKMERDLRMELAARLYDYGKCQISLVKGVSGMEKTNSLEKIKQTFSEVIRSDKELRTMPARIMICLLTIANVEIKLNDLDTAKAKLQEAETILKEYKEDYERKSRLDNTTRASYSIPPGIFKQNLMYLKALHARKNGLTSEACKILTDALELETRYDPSVRRRCLLELKDIFQKQKLLDEVPNIEKLLDNYTSKDKDVIVVLDCSQSMGQGARLPLIIKNLCSMFDNYLRPNDRIGYINFNLNCDIIFTLTEKKKNTSQMRKLLEGIPRPSGGTALYTAIYDAMKLLDKAPQKNSTKWIIVLMDGDDNDSRVNYEQTYRKLARSDVNVAMMGLALHQVVVTKMRYLCKTTKGGIFVESPSEDRIDEAFNIINSVVFGQDFKGEDITFDI